MSQYRNLRLFSTHPHPCSYLDGQEATTVFLDPKTEMDPGLYSYLSRLGFRRSGPHIYRPHCEHCQQCIATRIPVQRFRPRRSQQRNWQRNADLRAVEFDELGEEAYALYARYIEARHYDGDMYPPSRAQFQEFLSREWGTTRFTGFTDGEQLLAVAVYDQLDDGLSAIYTFYDPVQARDRGLGNYVILWQIEETRRLGLQHVYLGYWIRDCEKMNYKTRFRPLEMLVNRRWLSLE
jgi:leucyl-tRNA---protein transferase